MENASSPVRNAAASTWNVSTPPDFHKFVALTRSKSRARSLSPEKELHQMTKRPSTESWHLGAPLFDPITESYQCHEGHHLKEQSVGEYIEKQYIGVMCDFCSTMMKTEKYAAKETDSATKAARKLGERGSLKWFRCEDCDSDFCPDCMAFIKSEMRFNKPTMQCTSCNQLTRENRLAQHRCGKQDESAVEAAQHTYVVTVVSIPQEATQEDMVKLMGLGKAAGEIKTVADPSEDSSLKSVVLRFKSLTKAEMTRQSVRRRRNTMPFTCDATATIERVGQ